jgi:hypothetical protein
MTEEQKPGQPAQQSGIYRRTDGEEVALSKGDRVPPGRQGEHDTFRIVRPTRQPKK